VAQLEGELLTLDSAVTSRSIELKARVAKLASSKQMNEILKRLEIKGEPVWGLSTKERELVRAARARYNS
jgi:hypothetical protein